MQMFIRELPAFLAILSLTCFFKLSARLLRRIAVGWLDCFLIALALAVMAGVVNLCGLSLANLLPDNLATTLLPGVLAAGIGAWYFRDIARRADGRPLGWAGAIKMSALAVLLMALAALLCIVLVPLLALVLSGLH